MSQYMIDMACNAMICTEQELAVAVHRYKIAMHQKLELNGSEWLERFMALPVEKQQGYLYNHGYKDAAPAAPRSSSGWLNGFIWGMVASAALILPSCFAHWVLNHG